ncbi:class I SAM-dependent methyltransferase [Lentibacillus sediminis]|uniref:class I SAM-dependent methyltransferase n=1 Tax=Lentibacillus sediminis TaxID=1940529 RepID=UPI000C1C3494|nr:class I SAM-dependent methyltransferase [Lentibacillus sediminis]
MKQNKYDDPEFFKQYSQMNRSVEGLSAAGEWSAFRKMFPNLKDKLVLDLGCGFGWHCRYARQQQARSVVGVDISEKMLARARELTDDSAIEYYRLAMEEVDFPADEFDVVVSSLALHYVEDFQSICQKVYRYLMPGGSFVLSVEHPIFTARAAQDWYYSAEGERLYWPVDDYQKEGLRQTQFLGMDVEKYHRSIATYFNTVIRAGFRVTEVSEPEPTPEAMAKYPEMQDEYRRPMFLMMVAVKD